MRRLLHVLDGVPGAVLALGGNHPVRSAPAVGERLRNHVRSYRPEVEQLLNALVGHAVVVDGGWEHAVDVAIDHPDAVVVTSAGESVLPRERWDEARRVDLLIARPHSASAPD